MFTFPQKIYLGYVGALWLVTGGCFMKAAYNIGKAKGALDQVIEDEKDYWELMTKYVDKCKELREAKS